MTTIPAVKAALVTLCASTLPSSQVIYGPITSVTTTTGRVVCVGNVAGIRDLDSLAMTSTVERYTVDLSVFADLPGTNMQAADEQALSDYEDLVTAILANFTLGLGNVEVVPTGEFELREKADSDGRHAAVTFSVSVTAQNLEV